MVDYLGPLALTGTGYGGTQFAHPFDNDNLDNSFRSTTRSSTRARTTLASSSAACMASRTTRASFANNRAYSAGASYNYGPLNVAAAYLQLNNNLTWPMNTRNGASLATTR